MDIAGESIKEYLLRKLKEAGPSRFEEIARSTGVASSFIRKFVYGSREDPRIKTVQPLLDYFRAAERPQPKAKGAPKPSPVQEGA